MKATALWHILPTESTLQQASLASLKEGQVLIKSLYSLISTGTERLVAKGFVPNSMYENMRVPFMKGTFDFPLKYGYSLVGKIISNGALKGQLVHLLHPHQDYLIVDSQMISVVPNGISSKRAALASNIETALNAVWDSGVSIGDRVVVVGFGMIGGLLARVLSKIPAVELFVVEKNKFRARLAKKMGFKVNPANLKNLDISYHTTSSTQGLQTSIDAVGMEGKIVELSWYGTKETKVNLGGDFHYQRKQIISSQVAHIPFTKQVRWDYQRRKKVVWELLQDPLFEEHLTHEVLFANTPTFFNQLRTSNVADEGLGWVIRYE